MLTTPLITPNITSNNTFNPHYFLFQRPFGLSASFGVVKVGQNFIWPCSHAASIWRKRAMAVKFYAEIDTSTLRALRSHELSNIERKR